MGRSFSEGFSLANLLAVLMRMEKEGELVPKTHEKQDKIEGWH